MDELNLVRELRAASQAPRPEVVTAARARMWQDSKRRSQVRVRAGVAVLTACATGGAVAIALVPAGSAPTGGLPVFALPPGAAGTQAGGTAARHILLTAAQTVAGGQTPAIKRFWEIPAVAGNFIPVGHGAKSYLILEKTANDQFMDNHQKYSPQAVRALGVELASAADRAAWVRAGSPKTWPVNQEFTLDTPYGPSVEEMFDVTAGRGPLFDIDSVGGSQPFTIGDSSLSYRQLLALPASPRRLEKVLLKGWQPGELGNASSFLFQTAPTVLDMPVTPAVRAALYRMLAGLPGVRSVGRVPDVAGQRGPAVTLTERYKHCGHYSRPRFVQTGTRIVKARTAGGKWVKIKEPTGYSVGGYLFSSCVVQQRLIINPVTGLPLSQELRFRKLPHGQTWSAPGGLFSYELFGTPKWVAVLPHRDPHGH